MLPAILFRRKRRLKLLYEFQIQRPPEILLSLQFEVHIEKILSSLRTFQAINLELGIRIFPWVLTTKS